MKKNNMLPHYISTNGRKLLLIMRLSIMLSLLCSLTFAANIYSQKNISLQVENAKVKDIFSIIEKQTSYRFFYNDELSDVNRITNIDVENKDIASVLDQLFVNSDISYTMLANHLVVIAPKRVVVQQQKISGTITDSVTGESLIGVSVVVEGTSTGVMTGTDGKFTIDSPNPNPVLVFSSIGYTTIKVDMNGRTSINVQMVADIKSLDEILVVGYGTQKKSVVTGAISVVKSEDIGNKKITRLDDALQGLTSGVTVAASSGAPGSAPTIRVRGTTSINSSDPIYVVDGIVINSGIDYLNPNDISSIEVLKDAASASIYGAKASNGVIIIVTKKGKAGTPLQANYNMQIGVQRPIKKVKLTNATQYAELRNQAKINDGESALFTDPSSFGTGTNWQDQIFSNNAGYQNHNLSISGGTDKALYYSSFGYIDQNGIVASSIAYNKKLTFTANTSFNINKYVTIGENLSYTYSKYQTGLNTNSEFGGPLSSALNLDPITPVYADSATASTYNAYAVKDGDKYYAISKYVAQEITNPKAYIQTQKGNYGWSDNLVGNLYMEITPIKDLKMKSSINLKKAFWGTESYTPLYYLNASTSNTSSTTQYRESDQNLIWNWDNTISYSKSIGSHNLSAMVGTSAEKVTARGVNGTYTGEPATTFDEASFNYSLSATDRVASGYEDQDYALASYFGRVTYNYKEKYLLNGIVRRDGSSKFGSNNRYGVFPSASAGWVVTREDFFPKEIFLNNLKLRASYGIVGNEMSLGNFAYESLVVSGSNYVLGSDNLTIGYATSSPANPDLKWEETHSVDLGFDAIVFKDFSVTFDAYKKTTKGMLQTVDLPDYAGYSGSPYANVGNMENKGLELEVGYHKTLGGLSMNLSGNISYLKNEVTYLGDGKEYLSGGSTLQSSTYALTRTAVGHAIGSFYGFKSLGVFHSLDDVNNYAYSDGTLIQPNAKPGDLKWQDTDGKDGITSDDRTYIGDPTPKWTYGLTINLSYKNLDFLIFGQGVWGNDIFQAYRRLDVPAANYPIAALNAWTSTNYNSNYPRLTDSDPNCNYTNPSNFYLQNGAYLRIKNVQIGYTLPRSWTNTIGLQKVRAYVSTSNLLTITKYNGYDPEVGGSSYGIDRGIYPQSRTFMFGLNVGL
jgi:TonB-dependent starch-binding outer membrane protein SusC